MLNLHCLIVEITLFMGLVFPRIRYFHFFRFSKPYLKLYFNFLWMSSNSSMAFISVESITSYKTPREYNIDLSKAGRIPHSLKFPGKNPTTFHSYLCSIYDLTLLEKIFKSHMAYICHVTFLTLLISIRVNINFSSPCIRDPLLASLCLVFSKRHNPSSFKTGLLVS